MARDQRISGSFQGVRRQLHAAGMVAAVLAGAPGLAQTSSSEAEGADAKTTIEQQGLEEIVVTAERRSESLQRSSIAIDVVSADTIARAGVTTSAALSAVTPGLQIGGGGGFTQIFIRGIGDRSNTFLSNASVTTNLDGVPLLRATAVNGNFFDIQRIEVLKGPQGTLYGRNATGGAINILTNRPVDSFEGRLNGEFGSDNLRNFDGAINVPVASTLALRGAFQVIDRDGYLSDGSQDDKQRNGRISMAWNPTADVSLLLTGGYSHQGGVGSGLALISPLCTPTTGCVGEWIGLNDPIANTVRLNNNPPASTGLAPYPAPGIRQRLDNTNAYLTGQLDWNLGPATLTVLPSYHRNHYVAGWYPGLVSFNDNTAVQKSVEVRLGNDSNLLKWVAGVFYADEDQTGPSLAFQSVAPVGIAAYHVTKSASIESQAAFAQATVGLTSQLRLIAGVRYTSETSGLDDDTYLCSLAACPGAFQSTIDDKEVETNRLTWKGGAEFDLTPTNFLYATYSTGFKAAGLYFAPVADPSYRPEKIKAFEVGSKNRFFDDKLQLNLSAYRWNYQDQVYNYVGPVPGTNIVTLVFINIGRGHVQGFSADIAAQPWRGATFRLAAEYADSEYTDFSYDALVNQKGPANTRCAVGPAHPNPNGVPVQTVDCAGRPFILAPEWSGIASFEQAFTLSSGARFTFGATANLISSRYSQLDYLPSEQLPSTTPVDLDLTYEPASGRWQLGAYVHNVGDVVTYTQSQALTGTGSATSPAGGPVIAGTIGPPRTAGVKASINF